MPILNCNSCGIEFSRKQSQISKYNSHYCSRNCFNKHLKISVIGKRFELKHENQIIENTAFCVKCKEYKDFSEFYVNARLTQRNCLAYDCKTCSKQNKKIDYIRTAELKKK